MLDFPGFRDFQPYETWKFRVCSERFQGVSGLVPDFTPEMLSRTQGTFMLCFLGEVVFEMLAAFFLIFEELAIIQSSLSRWSVPPQEATQLPILISGELI